MLVLVVLATLVSVAGYQIHRARQIQARVDQRWDTLSQTAPADDRVIIEYLRNQCTVSPNHDEPQALALYQDCVDKAVVHLAAQSRAIQLDSTSLDQLRATVAQSF